MVKSKSIGKGQIQFTHNNGIQAVYLTEFKQAKVYFNDKHIDTITNADSLTVSQFCAKLEGYGKR